MRYRRSLFVFLGTAVLLTAQAQDPAAPEAPARQPQEVAEEAQPAATDEPSEATPSESTPARAPAKTAPAAERFEPTEKVRADFDVSFPVDI